ncbi:MBT domain-containing protein [Hymenobacter armeniacus]|uniref:Uncharacterized protein n=1 Tax=Hymenobacter armeniacus TaxID=2771358 RepID=A0ABR8JKR3_9BACT|nr:hypothetical protein [Hymenobacter armeniacus]MBD2720604.1 hypothetical protein [Hymenobacter armeniacus]
MRLPLLLVCALSCTAAFGQAGNFKTGELVSVNAYGVSFEATVLEIAQGKYKVHYEDRDSPDEWVAADKITKFNAGKTAGGPVRGKYICNLLSPTGWYYSGTFEI